MKSIGVRAGPDSNGFLPLRSSAGSGGRTIIVEGLGDEAFRFALELQKSTSIPLNAIDMEFTFQLALKNYRSVSEVKSALRFGMASPQQTNGVG